MAILIEEEVLSKEIDNLLNYLSKKYNVSKPFWLYSSNLPFKAIYDPILKLIVFKEASPEIIIHEFFHHYCHEFQILDPEALIVFLTNEELKNLEKEKAISDFWKKSYQGINPVFPIVFTILGIFYDFLSLNPNISVEEKDTFSSIGVSLSIFGLIGGLLI
jgi:hypothetical protein